MASQCWLVLKFLLKQVGNTRLGETVVLYDVVDVVVSDVTAPGGDVVIVLF